MNNKELLEASANEKPLYKFFKDCEFLKTVALEQAPSKGKASKWSLLFSVSEKDPCATLKRIFGITNGTFDSKFEEAISGFEKKRIMTLHSSSLVALLLFHSVSEKNPIYIPINGNPVAFTSVKFEERNRVDKDDPKNESHIDVMLLGNDCRLYLESKFSEYLSSGESEISATDYYKAIYERLEKCLQQCGLTIEVKDENIYIKGRGKYRGGAKQMISHYLGIRTKMATSSDIKESTVILGAVLFGFDGKMKKKLEGYKEIYTSLKEGLAESAKEDNINLTINDLITYQQIFALEENCSFVNNLPENIRQFYRL